MVAQGGQTAAGAGDGAGSSNVAAAGAAGVGGAVTPAGISCSPGPDGNGIHEQPEPYGKPAEATLKPGVTPGLLSPLTPFESALYRGHVFGYRLYVPAAYQPGKPAAMMVFQDGPSHYLGQSEAKFFANVVLDNLIAEGSIPVSLGLFVDTCMTACDNDRVAVYDDISQKYASFLLDELIPGVVLNQYAVVADPAGWATIGFSAGGIQAFTTAWHRPDAFGKVIGHNTSFPASKAHGADYAKLLLEAPNKGFRTSLVSGSADLSDARGNWLEASQEIAGALAAKDYPVRLMTGTGGHYPPDQASMDFPDALRWLWRGCKLAGY